MDALYTMTLAQKAIEFAFSVPTASTDTLVPYTMEELENIATSMLTNGPGWFDGDSPLYQNDPPPNEEEIQQALKTVKNFFQKCNPKPVKINTNDIDTMLSFCHWLTDLINRNKKKTVADLKSTLQNLPDETPIDDLQNLLS